ncbi:ATP synthase F1 subunit delta [Anaerosporobacter sp.]
MTQEAINNAKVLYELIKDRETIDSFKVLLDSVSKLREILVNPVIQLEKKHRIIDKIAEACAYPVVFKNFLKRLCDYGQVDELEEIFQAFDEYWNEKHDILQAKIFCATQPEDTKLDQVMDFLKNKYPGKVIQTEVCIDENLLGGMCIRVGTEEYDWSYEGRLKQLERKLTGR